MNCIFDFADSFFVILLKIRQKCKNIWLFEKKVVLLRSIFENNPIKNNKCRILYVKYSFRCP